MWWKGDRCGYTPDLSEAGDYAADEAARIVVPAFPPGSNVSMERTLAETFKPGATYD